MQVFAAAGLNWQEHLVVGPEFSLPVRDCSERGQSCEGFGEAKVAGTV
ncbi:MAG: hypothetical protein AAGD25_38740 [Cyanobacteria bacterium P01_F01_bin.150]